MGSAMKKDVNISSTKESLRIVEKIVDELSLELELSDEVYGNVLVATMEATNNAITHGNRLDPDKTVNISIIGDQDELFIKISNQGPGFDFENVPDPTSPENIEKINGRGIFLMKRLSDDIKFYDSGRVVELKFTL
jgi:serine/threonine-protein kinase RsbW